jgi:hypothetical protein
LTARKAVLLPPFIPLPISREHQKAGTSVNPFALTTALQRLVLDHHQHALSPDRKYIVCFDADGGEVPFEEVFAATPKEKHGEAEAISPTPGVGHYAHLRVRKENITPEGVVTRYELAAPDWNATIDVAQPVRGQITTTAALHNVTPGTARFFANYV